MVTLVLSLCSGLKNSNVLSEGEWWLTTDDSLKVVIFDLTQGGDTADRILKHGLEHVIGYTITRLLVVGGSLVNPFDDVLG